MSKPVLAKLLFFTLLLLALFGGLHLMDLRGEEPRRALVAWEMIFRQDYLQPTIQGMPYYNKPPVFNWVMAFFFQWLGPANWVVRVPSLVAFLALGVVHYRFVATEINQATAFWSTVFLFTSAHLLYFATVVSGELDLFYAFFVYLQAISIYYFHKKRSWLWLFTTSYLLMSIGFLIKGLPAIAFQGLTLLGWAFAKNSWRWLFSWQHIVGGLMSIGLIGGYFFVYDLYYDNGWLYLVNLLEEATQKSAAEGSLGRILRQLIDFPLQFMVDYLPWSLLLLLFLKRENQEALREQPFLLFCVLFFAANIWLYWISPGARNRYLYGFIPFFLTPLTYLFLKKPLFARPWLWVLVITMGSLRVAYNYTILPYQQKTMGNIQLYRGIADEAQTIALGAPLYTCCQEDTILVNPSLGPVTLLQDTILIPMYMPYQIPFYIQRSRKQLLPFRRKPDQPGYYLSTDTLIGPALRRYEVWDDKTLYLFQVE